jgi:glucose-1-phosphate thymidylyltransferase
LIYALTGRSRFDIWNERETPMKGIVLAGGTGSRMGELTKGVNKHLLPVGDWPMIYYPIKKLVGIGIKEIMLVTSPEHISQFVNLLGSGRKLNCNLTYKIQDQPGGVAEALGTTQDFGSSTKSIVVLLGDNIFYDPLGPIIEKARFYDGAHIVLKEVEEPERYGIAVFKKDGFRLKTLVEKPQNSESNLAVTGIYKYTHLNGSYTNVYQHIPHLDRSSRGEFEITDVNNRFLANDKLGYSILHNYWTDAGSPDTYRLANQLVREKLPEF